MGPYILKIHNSYECALKQYRKGQNGWGINETDLTKS